MNSLMVTSTVNSSFLFLTFFVLLQTFLTVVSQPPYRRYTPTEIIFLDCGSSASGTGHDGRQWIGDINSKFGPEEASNDRSMAAFALTQGSSVDSVPYMTARISRSQFKYIFPVTAGPKFIRLHFYPVSYMGDHDRYKDYFDVRAGAFTLLKNFSASMYADAWKVETLVKEFIVKVDGRRQLNITFDPFREDSDDSYAFINGIEIVAMPTYLYYPNSSTVKDGLIFIDETGAALETICRLNVGGAFLSSSQDTGMYREWTPDDLYFYSQNSVITRDPSISPNYSRIPAYTAPVDVYRSARSVGSNATNHLLQNLTWLVRVHQGFRYQVRLHFCEFVPSVTKINDRRFIINIGGKDDEGLDVIERSGGSKIPFQIGYSVTAGYTGNHTDYLLFITLRPDMSSLYKDVFLNGLEVLKWSDSYQNLAEPNPRSNRFPPKPGKPINKLKKLRIAAGGSVASFLLIISLLCCFVVWRVRNQKHYDSFCKSMSLCCSQYFWNQDKGKSSNSSKASLFLDDRLYHHFSLVQIKAATKNFSENLVVGEGGFGKVYRAEINNGVVAIKRLNPGSTQGFQEFKTEIETLSQLRHVHLVSLIGYCADEGEMILVYDFMINGTLRDHLYQTNNDPLPWKQRLEICIGAARGLDYLHSGVAKTIIHRDVKTTNILLDEQWVAKVSDFGLSKIGLSNAAITTFVKGTWGYLDPEYARRHQLSDKSDVYSFGVVLLEVLCARKPLDDKLEHEQLHLANWARKCIRNQTIHEMIDPYLMGKIAPECFRVFLEIAERCVCDRWNERPIMHEVMEKLELALDLQRVAETDNKEDHFGDEYFYPEISFKGQHINVGSGLRVYSSSYTGETSHSTLESRSITSGNVELDTSSGAF